MIPYWVVTIFVAGLYGGVLVWAWWKITYGDNR